MNRVRVALQDHMLLIVAVAMLLNGFLQVQVMRQQRDVLAEHEKQMERWADAVTLIAAWQGPTQIQTQGALDGKPIGLVMQQARAADDVDILIDRQRAGLHRIMEK